MIYNLGKLHQTKGPALHHRIYGPMYMAMEFTIKPYDSKPDVLIKQWNEPFKVILRYQIRDGYLQEKGALLQAAIYTLNL